MVFLLGTAEIISAPKCFVNDKAQNKTFIAT